VMILNDILVVAVALTTQERELKLCQ